MPEITPDILAAADKVERDLGKLDVSTRALLALVRHDQGGSAGGAGPDGTEYYFALTVASAEVDAALTDFPVYVSLADAPAAFWTNVQSDGGDIRVTESDGTTRCPVDLVAIDTTGETGEMHFLAGSLSAVSDTVYRVYYGKTGGGLSQPAVTDTNGRNAVWADYELVWHMQEDPSGSAPQIVDSTGNGNNGTSNGSMTSGDSVAGKLAGEALDLDGSNDYIVTSAALDATDDLDYALSCWTNTASTATKTLLSQFDFSTADSVALYNSSGNGYTSWVADGAATYNASTGSGARITGSWVHLAAVVDGADNQVYVNGAASGSPVSVAGLAPINSAFTFRVGTDDSQVATRWWVGQVDEVRVRSSAPSADFLAAEYSNQNTPTTFYSVGTQQNA